MNTQEVVASTEEMMLPASVAASVAAGAPWAVWRASLAAWLNRCADQWAAAAAYEELSRLSDAQLDYRALRRDTLARDLTA
jgi:gamma-glutamylcysteine synthetase